MRHQLLRIIFFVLWLLAFSYITSYVPKSMGYLLICFPIGFIGLFFILWVFRDKQDKTSKNDKISN